MIRTHGVSQLSRVGAFGALVVGATLSTGCGRGANMPGPSTTQSEAAPAAAGAPAAGAAAPARDGAVGVPVEKADPVKKAQAPPSVRPRKPAASRSTTVASRAAGPDGDGRAPLAVPSPASRAAGAPVAVQRALPRPAAVDRTPAPARAVSSRTTAPGDEEDRSPIYSQADVDVRPARLLSKQGGGPLFRDAPVDTNTMELVISEQGLVERVKLTTPPKRMTDMLLLSGAKTWKFSPAMKDGVPVRYRTYFSWEMLP